MGLFINPNTVTMTQSLIPVAETFLFNGESVFFFLMECFSSTRRGKLMFSQFVNYF